MISTIRPLTVADAPAVQSLLERAAEYTRRVRGVAPGPGDGLEVLTARPPGTDAAAKCVVGLCDPADADRLLALCDVICHWPEPGTAHIGLLLVDPSARGTGLGRALHDSVVAQLRAFPTLRMHPDLHTLRAGVVGTNADVTGFWTGLGYRPTGERLPYEHGTIRSETTILARQLADARMPGEPPLDRPRASLHHLEMWTSDLARTAPAWGWLLTQLGWRLERVEGWENGRIWHAPDGSYLVLEQSADGIGDRAERCAPGMNHVAITAGDRAQLDMIRADGAAHGWTELFGDSYPNAGGPDHTAWYAEDPDGIEVEVVAVRWP